jgi:hypothetical protein
MFQKIIDKWFYVAWHMKVMSLQQIQRRRSAFQKRHDATLLDNERI